MYSEDYWFFGTLIGLFLFVMVVVTGGVYYSSCREARVINMARGTEYTCGDVFFAGDAIREISEGTKHRLELEDK